MRYDDPLENDGLDFCFFSYSLSTHYNHIIIFFTDFFLSKFCKCEKLKFILQQQKNNAVIDFNFVFNIRLWLWS